MIVTETLELRLNSLWSQFQNGSFSKGDIVSLFLISYNQLFPEKNWLSWNSKRQHTRHSFKSVFFPKQDELWRHHPFFKKTPENSSLGLIMNQSVFKKETLRTNLGLMHVYTHPETVKILDYIPSPFELLEMQANGLRCVTLLRSSHWFLHSFDHRRNIRDFVIHDLEHIWQMFEDPQMTQQQVLFSKTLLKMTVEGHFDFLLNDPNFRPEFNYIISDMNTHPAHMYATLKSLILRQKSHTHEILIPFHDFVPAMER